MLYILIAEVILLIVLFSSIVAKSQLQKVNLAFVSSSPSTSLSPNGYYYIDICQGDTVEFTVKGDYPENDNNYHQADVSSTFDWDFGDESNVSQVGKATIKKQFQNEGGYIIKIVITDTQGSKSTNDLKIRVRVSTTPNFAQTMANKDAICIDNCVELNDSVVAQNWKKEISKVLADTTFLPDGSGDSYTSEITFNNFLPNQKLTSVSDLESICLNMEHSYIGDLDIAIECPNAQRMDILIGDSLTQYVFNSGNFHIVEAILGEPVATNLPVDDNTSDTDKGIGYDYCFSQNSTNGLLYHTANVYDITPYTDPKGNISDGSDGPIYQVASNDYDIDGNWTDLIGCPLNGEWKIVVTDNLSKDNGWLFSWGIKFNPLLLSDTISFTPSIVANSGNWSGDYLQNTVPETVCPTIAGEYLYNYQIEDSFGCKYDTTINVSVGGPFLHEETKTICDGSSYNWQGTNYSNVGSYLANYNTIHGCDSIHKLDLDIADNYDFAEDTIICDGSSYNWHDTDCNAIGSYFANYNTIHGCDSIYNLDLDIADNYDFAETKIICDGSSYNWQGDDYSTIGSYLAEYNTIHGCDSIYNLYLDNYPIKQATIIADKNTYYLLGDTVKLSLADGDSFDSYKWNVPYSITDETEYLQTAIIINNDNTIYKITVTDDNSCITEAEFKIDTKTDLIIYNVFTPNGDGFNDLWHIDNLFLYENNEVNIFDRLGGLIYSTKEYHNNEWDGTHKGKKSPTGIYYFVLKLKDRASVYTGDITIFR